MAKKAIGLVKSVVSDMVGQFKYHVWVHRNFDLI